MEFTIRAFTGADADDIASWRYPVPYDVYDLTEDSFVVCFAAPGKDRPAELNAKGGPGLRVLAFKREKK